MAGTDTPHVSLHKAKQVSLLFVVGVRESMDYQRHYLPKHSAV